MNLAAFGRLNEQFVGIDPRLCPRLRCAAVSATSPLHISARTSLALAVGVNRVLRLDPCRPPVEMAADLQAFQPEVLVGYPSALALLAGEQLAGRLDVRPKTVVTVSEVRTAEMEETIRAAWGVDPFDWYGISEGGVLAGDCRSPSIPSPCAARSPTWRRSVSTGSFMTRTAYTFSPSSTKEWIPMR